MAARIKENKLYPAENIIAGETLDWHLMSPAERFAESQKLWEVFILLGGNYEPEPDTQSPLHPFKP
jgi:hypothetical protein